MVCTKNTWNITITTYIPTYTLYIILFYYNYKNKESIYRFLLAVCIAQCTLYIVICMYKLQF